ncbi:hypothetical protein EV426DRAFT_707465 [Tirmania nivea]|nr:hypothetical protein EV426DRAFT_707465 [Tirmania nivea]
MASEITPNFDIGPSTGSEFSVSTAENEDTPTLHGGAPNRLTTRSIAFAQEENDRVSATIYAPSALGPSCNDLDTMSKSTEGNCSITASSSVMMTFSSTSINPSGEPDNVNKKASMRSRLFQLECSESHTFRAPSEFPFTATIGENTETKLPAVATGAQGKIMTDGTATAAAEMSTELSASIKPLTSNRRPLPPLPSGARGHRRRSAVVDIGTFGAELASRDKIAHPSESHTAERAAAAAHDRALTVRAELLREEGHPERSDRMGDESVNDQAELKDPLNQGGRTKLGNSRKHVTWNDTLVQVFLPGTLMDDPARSDQDEEAESDDESGEGEPCDKFKSVSDYGDISNRTFSRLITRSLNLSGNIAAPRSSVLCSEIQNLGWGELGASGSHQ